MTIEILGLSKRQRALADILWSMNSKEDCHRFIASLDPLTRRDAETVVDMMILAVIDQVDHVDQAQEVINRIKEIK